MAPVYKNFIYDAERGFIFAYVPKVACTNWKSLLRYMAGYDNWLDNKLAHDKVNGGLRYLELTGPDAALLTDPGVRKYAMVRDPYSRVLSAYLNKVEGRLPVKPAGTGDHFDTVVRDIDMFRRMALGDDRFPQINLEVFLRWLKAGSSPYVHDEHWALQSILLRQPELRFDQIGRFENLPEDSAAILQAMGCDQRFPSQKDVNFAPTGAVDKLARYYTPVCYKLVDDIYAEDFVQFGFEKRISTLTTSNVSAPAPAAPTAVPAAATTQLILGQRPAVIEEISENDWMWKGKKDKNVYLKAGWSVGRALYSSSLLADYPPKRILDFGCGHGRVMRWMRALYPDAEIVASDRVRDGVDFCAKTFNATPVYSNDSYEGIPLGGNFDLIWLGSVYTHLPMNLWSKVTRMLTGQLSPKGQLVFSFAGPFVAELLREGERNPSAEIEEGEMSSFFGDYDREGFGYARHEGVGDREWGRSIISHDRLFRFLHDENLAIKLLGERLYDSRQDIVATQKKSA